MRRNKTDSFCSRSARQEGGVSAFTVKSPLHAEGVQGAHSQRRCIAVRQAYADGVAVGQHAKGQRRLWTHEAQEWTRHGWVCAGVGKTRCAVVDFQNVALFQEDVEKGEGQHVASRRLDDFLAAGGEDGHWNGIAVQPKQLASLVGDDFISAIADVDP